jgi:hypothetical protein
MNIKGFNSLQIPTVPVSGQERQIKSDNTHDRDAQGQYFSQRQKKKVAMSDEQFDEALVKLNQKQFMTEMNWTAKKIVKDEIKFAEVRNQLNEIIRCISEFDLWDVFSDESPVEKNKGRLLKAVA